MATARGQQAQTIHMALLNSYLPPERTPPRRYGVRRPARPQAPSGNDALLHTLAHNQTRIPAPLLGIAVWNLVPRYTARSAPPTMNDLLGHVLDLDFPSAQRLRRNHLADAFPPYPDRFILDSSWTQDLRADRASMATLEVCVPRPFRDMQHVVNPASWSGDAFFWASVPHVDLPMVTRQRPGGPRRAPLRRTFHAHLNLPDAQPGAPLRVTIDAHISVDPFAVHVGFTMRANTQIEICEGSVSARKEEGRPGATRITMQRLLRLQSQRRTQPALLRYWLHSDAVCLALPGRAGEPRGSTR